MEDCLALDALLLARLGEGAAESRRRAGEAIRCGRGCFGCCLGPFPITEWDARRLRRGWAGLEEGARAAMREKAKEAAARLPEREAGDWLFDPEWQMMPCPALDLESGACGLYEHRPAACRTYGPAVRLDGVDLTPCPLNYEGWPEARIEAARVTIETGDLTEAMAASRLTTVAWALLAD
jgi:Fe-S-cluster containining protein